MTTENERQTYFICSYFSPEEVFWHFIKTTPRGAKIFLTVESKMPDRQTKLYLLLDSEWPKRLPDGTPSRDTYLAMEYPGGETLAKVPGTVVVESVEEKRGRKRGRPPIPEEDRVGKKAITLYMTLDQYDEVKEAAKAAGLSMQKYLVGRLFDEKVGNPPKE